MAKFYLGHPDYLNCGHQVGPLLTDAAHLRTQWAKGQIMTRSYGRAPPSTLKPRRLGTTCDVDKITIYDGDKVRTEE